MSMVQSTSLFFLLLTGCSDLTTNKQDSTTKSPQVSTNSSTASGSSTTTTNDPPNGHINQNVSSAYADCTARMAKSYPAQISITCTWKQACTETIQQPLGASIPESATVSMSHKARRTPSIELPVDAVHNAAVLTPDQCSAVGDVVIFSYTEKTITATTGERLLYAHPCGNGDPSVQECRPETNAIDVKGNVAACNSLALGEGDACPASLETCELIPARACASAPSRVIASPT